MEHLRRIQAGGLVLTAFTPAHHALLTLAFADPEVARWNPGPGTSPDDVLAWARARNDWGDGTHASWAVVGPDDVLLGSVSVHQVDRVQGDGEIGYWTGPWARGQGIATRAVAAATSAAFDGLGLHRLRLLHAVGNPASCRVALRCGYLQEGLLRQSYRYPDGALHDEHLHARLATD